MTDVRTTANPIDDCDVLILGAGAAGLNAARAIAGKHRVIVLEARDRVGGRLFTRHHPGEPLPVEFGPEFVHGRMPDTFSLLRESGLVAYDVAERHETTRNGKLASQDNAWGAADALLSRLSTTGDDQSFETFLRTHARRSTPAARQAATSFVEGFNAADRRRISCRSLARANEEESKYEDGEKQYRLVGGYDQLAAALAKHVTPPSRIDLKTVICEVHWQRGKVEVVAQASDGSHRRYRARAAVIALPLGVLQVQPETPASIKFEPELPLREAMRDLMVMGPVVKLTIRFKSPFWERRGMKDLSFFHRQDVAIPTWWTTLPLRTALLTGWAGGPAAEALWAGDLRDHAIKSLSQIFAMSRAAITREIEQIDHHDWQNDPFSRGAYSYAAVGGADLPEQLARPVHDTLFFAGEHTHGGSLGTVAGALHSGAAAAKRVMKGLR